MTRRFSALLIAVLALPLAALVPAADAYAKKKDEPPKAEKAQKPEKQPSNKKFLGVFGGDGNVPNAGPCPLTGVLYDASRVVAFAKPEEKFENVAYTGEILKVGGLCRYIGADPIKMSLQIDFAFGRGPASTSDSHKYRYWVAVTRRDVAPIAKQYFEIDAKFPSGGDRGEASETIANIVIPRATPEVSGENFEILVGFDLTPEQLAFNQAGRRFQVNAGQN